MAKLTIDDLKKIKEDTTKSNSLREGGATVKITVHMGTCGIAAGAREVMNALMEELGRIQKQGYAVSLGERTPGLGSVSAPIFDYKGQILASLSLAIPEIRITRQEIGKIVERELDERRQRALTRYYAAAGTGGVAVAVHTTQFAIREPHFGLHRPLLELAREEFDARDADRDEPLIRIAPQRARFVRIRQTGSKDGLWWSIHELDIRRSVDGSR